VAIEKLLDISLGHKRLERITERIGAERLVEVDQEVVAFKALTLTEKLAGPKNVRPLARVKRVVWMRSNGTRLAVHIFLVLP